MIHNWILQMDVDHLFFPKHHRPKLVRQKETEDAVLYHLVREELAELEELLALEVEVELGHHHLNVQLLIANVVVSVWTEVKGQKLGLLP